MKRLFVVILIALMALMALGYAEGDSSYSVGDTFCFGHYEQNGDITDGEESISWKILHIENNRALVISEKGLKAISYAPAMDINSYTVNDFSWENSYLRAWLNDDFLKTAFSEDEQACIIQSKVITHDAAGNCTTDDRLFCLSIDEVDRYFDSDKAMACEVTEEAKKGLHLDSGAITDGYGCWWMRDLTSSAGASGGANEAAYISGTYGTESAKKGSGMPVFCDYLSTVRPAMWVDLTNERLFAKPSGEEEQTEALISAGNTEDSDLVYTSLEKGMNGDAVRKLQERLNELNYEAGSPDGIFGNKTGNAVALFQKINGLPVTGIADVEMQRLLYEENAVCNLERLEGVSIVDRITSLIDAREEIAIARTETYTYEQYGNLQDYFAAFEISNPEDISVSNWYFFYDGIDDLIAYDEWKYIHVTYPQKKTAGENVERFNWEYGMFADTIPKLIAEASDRGYHIAAMDYAGKDMTDDEARKEAAASSEFAAGAAQSVADSQNAFNELDKNGDGKLSVEELFGTN